MNPRLRITEIFFSLQGETSTAGLPTAFVRLTGCPLRCVYCDTEYAFEGGQWMDLEAVMGEVGGYGARYVTVTGGEPLAQQDCLILLQSLCDAGYRVSLETSGAMDISAVDERVARIVDLKTPGSGMSDRNRLQNLDELRPPDELKFVLCDRADYDWAKEMCVQYDLPSRCAILFSPVHGALDAADLAGWILADNLPVRLQIQLHKYLWGEVPGR